MVREKADLFESVHNYEVKLEAEQSKKWIADEDVDSCTKCNVAFGWTVRKVRRVPSHRLIFYMCSLFSRSIIVDTVKRFSVTNVRTIGCQVPN